MFHAHILGNEIQLLQHGHEEVEPLAFDVMLCLDMIRSAGLGVVAKKVKLSL
jgi:hypothetical protein